MAPLDGVKVVEAASYMSGPWAGVMLADLGADVLKVEPPGGDPYRRFGRPATAVSAVWAACNRGKRNVVLDLKTTEGVRALVALAADADVFLSNWRPDVADRLGVGDAVLAAANPRMVRLWITGFGPDGPAADEPAFDTVVQARSGMADAVASGDRPVLVAGYPVDKLTAMMAVQAVLAALFARERTGAGDRIDLAMLDATAYAGVGDLLANRILVEDEAVEARYPGTTAQQTIPASDGAFVIAAVTGTQIKAASAAVGHPEWAAELFAEPGADGLVRAMARLFAPVTVTRPLAHWVARLKEHDVPAAPCLTIDQHLADPQVAHNRLYAVDEWPGLGKVRSVRYPAVSTTWGDLRAGPAPVELP